MVLVHCNKCAARVLEYVPRRAGRTDGVNANKLAWVCDCRGGRQREGRHCCLRPLPAVNVAANRGGVGREFTQLVPKSSAQCPKTWTRNSGLNRSCRYTYESQRHAAVCRLASSLPFPHRRQSLRLLMFMCCSCCCCSSSCCSSCWCCCRCSSQIGGCPNPRRSQQVTAVGSTHRGHELSKRRTQSGQRSKNSTLVITLRAR